MEEFEMLIVINIELQIRIAEAKLKACNEIVHHVKKLHVAMIKAEIEVLKLERKKYDLVIIDTSQINN